MGKITVLSHQDTQDVDIPVGRQINCGGSTDGAPMATQTPNFFDLQESHRAAGDSANRHEVFADGYTKWGPGNAGPDTFLYRDGAAKLRTNGVLAADGAVTARGGVECANLGDVPGGIRDVVITADIVRTSTAAPSATPFAFPVTAGVDYEITGLLILTGSAGDARFAWSTPALSLFAAYVGGLASAVTTATGVIDPAGAILANTQLVRAVANVDVVPFQAFLRPSASGTFTVLFAQGTSSATGSRIGAGSYMKCTRLP